MKAKLTELLALASACVGVIDHVAAWTDKWAKAVFPTHTALAATIPWLFQMVLIAPLLRLLWQAYCQSRYPYIAKPEVLEEPVGHGKGVPGRQQNIDEMANEISVAPLLMIVGEPGVGKTTLIRYGLVEVLRQHRSLLPVLVENKQWARNAGDAIAAALEGAVGCAPAAHDPSRRIPAAVREIFRSTGRRPLLILDNFESYVDYVSLDLVGRNQTIATFEEVSKRIPLWRTLRTAVVAGELKIAIGTRLAYAAQLSSFTFTNASICKLNRPEATVVSMLLTDLESKGFVSDVDHPEWTQIKHALIHAITSGGSVLPVQLQVALRGLATLRPLSLSEFRRHGAVLGLEARLIMSRVEGVSRETGVTKPVVVEILKSLFDPASTVLTPKTTSEVRAHLQSVADTDASIRVPSEDDIDHLLRRLQEWQIIGSQVEVGSQVLRWSLYHSYLHRAILRVERSLRSVNTTLMSRESQYATAPTLLTKWKALLGPVEIIRVAIASVRRQCNLRVYRRFVATSLVTFIPWIGCLLLPYALADASVSFPGSLILRNQLDGAGVSVFRTIYSESDVLASAERVVTFLKGSLRKQKDAEGWYQPYFGYNLPHERDTWSHAQLIAGLLEGSSATSEDCASALQGADLMFRVGRLVVDDEGNEIGWAGTMEVHYARAEPMLWTGIAIGRALQKCSQSNADQRWKDYAHRLAKIAGRYYQSDGSWNRFLHQSDVRIGSSYIAALAVTMLTEFRMASEEFQIQGLDRDTVLERTMTRLLYNYTGVQVQSQWITRVPVGATASCRPST